MTYSDPTGTCLLLLAGMDLTLRKTWQKTMNSLDSLAMASLINQGFPNSFIVIGDHNLRYLIQQIG